MTHQQHEMWLAFEFQWRKEHHFVQTQIFDRKQRIKNFDRVSFSYFKKGGKKIS